MNSNGMPFKKRNNPLSGSVAEEPKPVVEEVQPKPVIKTVAPKPVVKPAFDENTRLKYTATMDKDLHKRLKIAAAMTGIQISSFIEEAITEKLNREGL